MITIMNVMVTLVMMVNKNYLYCNDPSRMTVRIEDKCIDIVMIMIENSLK